MISPAEDETVFRGGPFDILGGGGCGRFSKKKIFLANINKKKIQPEAAEEKKKQAH